MEDDDHPLRRDLFFFDEAHSYQTDSFARFHRLVEFLFAEDSDVVVASTTMPAAFQEELSFLDVTRVAESPDAPTRSLVYVPAADPLAEIEARIRREYFQNARVFGVLDSPADAEALHARLASSYPHNVFLYHPAQPADARRRTYAQLRELEKEGEGYLLLTTGDALETSDLDATVLFSTLCPPENLIRRAGRCNRRGEMPTGQVVLVGDRLPPPPARSPRPTPTAPPSANTPARRSTPSSGRRLFRVRPERRPSPCPLPKVWARVQRPLRVGKPTQLPIAGEDG